MLYLCCVSPSLIVDSEGGIFRDDNKACQQEAVPKHEARSTHLLDVFFGEGARRACRGHRQFGVHAAYHKQTTKRTYVSQVASTDRQTDHKRAQLTPDRQQSWASTTPTQLTIVALSHGLRKSSLPNKANARARTHARTNDGSTKQTAVAACKPCSTDRFVNNNNNFSVAAFKHSSHARDRKRTNHVDGNIVVHNVLPQAFEDFHEVLV